jgi:hypothetical protein
MNQTLEHKLTGQEYPVFRSEGERRIADFLEDNSIKYQYEPALLINTEYEKPRIWYPDFYLPEFVTYIEYFGLVGRQQYDNGIKRKEAQYAKSGVSVIPVYPWTFTGKWQQYIMTELERITTNRLKTLMSKPYWSHSNLAIRHNSPPEQLRYYKANARHY